MIQHGRSPARSKTPGPRRPDRHRGPRRLLRGARPADFCINAVPTFAGHQMAVSDACLETRTTYVDYDGMGVFTVEQKKQAGVWRQAGVTAVLGLGADPGISNIICKAVAERLDRIDSINLYRAAARLGEESSVLVPPYNVATLLAESATAPCSSWKEVVLRLPQPWGET
jgi:saccharopine dehydrogenase-like NADP-dependent oxidoreductase